MFVNTSEDVGVFVSGELFISIFKIYVFEKLKASNSIQISEKLFFKYVSSFSKLLAISRTPSKANHTHTPISILYLSVALDVCCHIRFNILSILFG